MMRSLQNALAIALPVLLFTACTEEFQTESSLLSSIQSGSPSGSAPKEKLTQHDAALRFLTAYVRLDRNLALKYANYEAVSKLDWHRPHGSNIPYFDDKMILHFNGGWARVFFQEYNGSYRVSDLEVHRR